MKALILAGGYGKRLRPHTERTPKPLLEVGGKPILEWQIELLKRSGVREIVLAVGYLKEKVIERMGSGKDLGVSLVYVVEDEPMGTGGAIKNAESALRNEEAFIVMNGDIVTNLDVDKLCKALKNDPRALTYMALVPLPSPYGIVITDNAKVLEFKEKPILEDYWINAGIYCMRSEVFDYLPSSGDVERETFPKLASLGRLFSMRFREVFWKSVDSHKDLEELDKFLSTYSLF